MPSSRFTIPQALGACMDRAGPAQKGCDKGPVTPTTLIKRCDMNNQFRQYARRAKLSSLRDYKPGESLEGVSVSETDSPGSDPDDKVARNPENYEDQWFISGAYFRENFEPKPID